MSVDRNNGNSGLTDCIRRAQAAFRSLGDLTLDMRYGIVDAMREAVKTHVKELATSAVDETGMGRAEDKVRKNLLVAVKTPGPEILEPRVRTGDHGLSLMERAPHGVIGSVIPSTNPTETVINNSISMISGGNAVVFNAHPAAKACTQRCVDILNKAVVDAGGPEHLIGAVPEPTVETAKGLMHSPGIALVCVTGGPAVVREAMASGKKVIAAGPGNPPAVVDETADIEAAAKHIVSGASLDNNIICTDEKVVVVVDRVADALKQAMVAADCVEVTGKAIDRLCNVLFESRNGRQGVIDKRWVGKNANRILGEIGIDAPDATRLAIVDVDPDHPLGWTEQLLPVMPIVRVPDADKAIELGIAYEGGRRHTASMHSFHIGRLSAMARRINCSIFIKNGPNYAGLGMGGEGYTSFTIASPTGEGMTTAVHFTRERRCTLVDSFRIV